MKNVVGMLFCLIFINSTYSQSKEKCHFVKDSFELPVAILKDSSILNLIDSAISILKFEPILGNEIPYFLEIGSKSGKIKDGQSLIFNAQNWYGYSRFKEKNDIIYKPYMLLNYKNFQIVVPKGDELIVNFLTLSEKRSMYYIYSRYECQTVNTEYPFIKQEINFILNLKRKKFFALRSYKYYIDANSIYENNE